MTTSTITVSGGFTERPVTARPAKPVEKPKPQMIEATTTMDGFVATMKALHETGLDLKGIPMAVARMLYNSGVAFSKSDKTTEDERLRWRNSIIWPVKLDK